MSSFRVVIGLALVSSGCASSKLIPEFSVLQNPASESKFAIGRSWIPDVGPTGPRLQESRTAKADGVEDLDAKVIQSLDAGINAVVRKLVTIGLSGDANVITSISAKDLEHSFVVDPTDIRSTGTIIWEVVTASDFVINSSSAIHGSSKISLEDGSVPLELTATALDENSYRVRSDRRLVIALRLVDIDFKHSENTTRLDVSAAYHDLPQRGSLDYEFTVLSSDITHKTCAVRIRNPTIPNWEGEVHEISGSESVSVRHPVGQTGSNEVEYISDSFHLLWDEDGSWTRIVTNRQVFVPRASRLKVSGSL